MITLTIDEATLNATRAALDERVKRLEQVLRVIEKFGINDHEDTQRALVWNIAALHETRMAQEFYAEVELGQPEQSDPVTAAKAAHDPGWLNYHDYQARGPVTEPELLAGYGIEADSDVLNREGDPAFNGAFGGHNA